MRLLQRFRAALTAWRAAGTPSAPARLPQLGERFWLDGREHLISELHPNAQVSALATERAFDAEHLLPGRRVVRCASRDMVWLEAHRAWVLPGREGPMPTPTREG